MVGFPSPEAAAREVPLLTYWSNPATAAKIALRRKKAHEHSLEQTINQIGTLEQQVNAIESANINRETLAAMEKAAEAMKQIHGKLTPEKVDETMYVGCRACGSIPEVRWGQVQYVSATNGLINTGRRFAIKTLSARRLSMPSQAIPSESRSTRTSSRPNWRSCSRRHSTTRCLALATYPSAMPFTGCPLPQTESVSGPLTRYT